MANYRRAQQTGGTFFFTVVTHRRRPILASREAIDSLRSSIAHVKKTRPFRIDAMVVLPDHIHAIWTLPDGDTAFSIRWRLIKYRFSISYGRTLADTKSLRSKRERGIWQRRFWEHLIHDEEDFRRHFDYIHYNPVKHGLARAPAEWRYSSFRIHVKRGIYPSHWGTASIPRGIAEMNLE